MEHDYRVRVLSEWLEPCARTTEPGRTLTPGLTALVATLDRSGIAELAVRDLANGQNRATRSVVLSHHIARISWIEAGPGERIYALFHLFEQDPLDPHVVVHQELVGVVFDGDLRPTEEIHIPFAPTGRDQLREFKVGADGTVYQLQVSEFGVAVKQWRWSW